jgi:membrane fusion protein (multidrug efflux system)
MLTLQPQQVELTTELPGRTTAFLTADVRPQVNGIIKQRNFVEGSDVTINQPLYLIDPAPYQATYDSALATMAHDQAALATAKAKLARYQPLAAAHAVSQQDLDDTKVMAPISGRISRSAFTPGALVSSDQATALATVTQLDPIYVDVIQPVSTLLRLQRELAAGTMQSAGQNQARVMLKLEDGSDYKTPGKLQFSEVTVDQTTGTVLLRSIFPNPDHILLPGMYVRAELVEGVDTEALMVPQQAVSRNTHGDATVLMIGQGNMAEPHIVQADRTIGTDWLVTGGLKPGDQIIVDGMQKIRPGVPVAPGG